MGFYGPEPVEEARVIYVWTGVGEPGYFIVEACGEAPNYTYGIQLVRDPHFVGGLMVDVMGWTGPLGPGTTPYKVTHSFSGEYRPKIFIKGSNKTLAVNVEQIQAEDAESTIKKFLS